MADSSTKTGWMPESHEEYLKTEGLSSSVIKKFLSSSPAHVKHAMENPTEPTDSMVLGTHIHSALLLPTEFRPIVLPDPHTMGIKTKTGKLAENPTLTSEWKDFVSQAQASASEAGQPLLTHTQMEIIGGVMASVMDNPLATQLISGGVPEVSGYADGFKIRPDYRRRGTEIVDLKTTRDASPAAFARQARTLRYDIQAYLYRLVTAQIEGVRIDDTDFVWLAVETLPPYGVAVYRPNADDLLRAAEDVKSARNLFDQCLATGGWHGYPEIIQTLNLFAFGTRDSDDDDQTF